MGTEEGWAALSKEVDLFAEESDDELDDDNDNLSVTKLPNASKDGEEAAVAIDTELDADRFAHDAELIDEFEDIDKCRLDHFDEDVPLPPLTVEDRKEACVLLSKVRVFFCFFLFVYIYIYYIFTNYFLNIS